MGRTPRPATWAAVLVVALVALGFALNLGQGGDAETGETSALSPTGAEMLVGALAVVTPFLVLCALALLMRRLRTRRRSEQHDQ